jgi:hypothetical protein
VCVLLHYIVTDDDKWKEFRSAWWALCKRTDSRSKEPHTPGAIADFEQDFWNLKTQVLAGGGNKSAIKSALEWLDTLYDRREKWAACYTWGTGWWR